MANQDGVPALPASRRYILMYRARAMNTIRKLYPCKTYGGAAPCCEQANSWADPCLFHRVKVRCNQCEEEQMIQLSLRNCPDYRPPPYLPRIQPVQCHFQIECDICNTQGTIVILRFGAQPLDTDNQAKAFLEIQLEGPFQVVVRELLVEATGLPFSRYCCQGPATKPPRTRYQGKIEQVTEDGHNIMFNRLKVDGLPLQIEGFDGFWVEGLWRADNWFEKLGVRHVNDFTGKRPGWPPTQQEYADYYHNHPNYDGAYEEYVTNNLML